MTDYATHMAADAPVSHQARTLGGTAGLQHPTGGNLAQQFGTQDFSFTKDAGTPATSSPAAPAQSRRPRAYKSGLIDKTLLDRAFELLDSLDPGDAYETPLHLNSLAGTLMALWESAADCSQLHQDILAILENAVTCMRADDTLVLTESRLRVLREALNDLRQPQLAGAHVEVARSQFIREGFPPLGFADANDNFTDAPD